MKNIALQNSIFITQVVNFEIPCPLHFC